MIELSSVQLVAIAILPVLFAITLHEVAHGFVAYLCGDQTARLSGRLTLNPIKHIDLVGTIILPIITLALANFFFGWAKPVPVDSRNLHKPRRDMALVAAAGPTANFVMALFWGVIAKIGMLSLEATPQLSVFLVYSGEFGITVNVIFMVLNFLPFPPLDGGRIVVSLLPPRLAWYFVAFERYLFVILFLLMITGVLFSVIAPPIVVCKQWLFTAFGLPYLGV